MGGKFYELKQQKQEYELKEILDCNKQSSQYGLSLTKEEAYQLACSRNESLKKYQRVEFGKGILDKLIDTFCDSQYIDQYHYLDMLTELQDIFYLFKNECADKLTDDELLTFMKEQFETVCAGDLEYLEQTCLGRFAAAVRAGYTGYTKSGGSKEYEQFSEEQRWDKELYMETLKELCWR